VKLSQILSQVKTPYKILSKIDEIEIADIALDSRLVKKNSAFFALQGKAKDGSEFISDAIKNGASVVVLGEGLTPPLLVGDGYGEGCFLIESSDPFSLLIEFLKIFHKALPANIYAITGTNGKTSTAEFTRQILQFLGKKSASIGTLGVMCEASIQERLQVSSLTTPDIVSLYKNLEILKENGVDDVAIEVSSIGLEQGRIAGLKIDVGAFTNFTVDHLDYHKTMEEYLRCKMILFERILENGSVAVLNSDISEFEKLKKSCVAKNHKIIEYGFEAHDLCLQKIEQIADGQKIYFSFEQRNYQFYLAVSGDFQAFNALCALGNVLAKNKLNFEQLENLLKNFHLLQPAAGRMQRVAFLPNEAQIFIDFAHSPDALKNVLQLARKMTEARVLVLFGCGGNRDASKRPIMGEIASDLADFVIITDDNPRNEKPEEIRAEILKNCEAKKTIEIDGRKTAIEKAITMLEAGDILILAGKGHEKYQIIGDKKSEFDEELIVKNALTKSS
jgi:UDP-N-acetylmuramoyl-L-alanyl-D-glutamate--2,6-diaminopimelate ligase